MTGQVLPVYIVMAELELRAPSRKSSLGARSSSSAEHNLTAHLCRVDPIELVEKLKSQPGIVWFYDVLFPGGSGDELSIFVKLWQEGSIRSALFTNERNLNLFVSKLYELGANNVEYPRIALMPVPIELEVELNQKKSSNRLDIAFCGNTNIEFRAHVLLSALKKLDIPWHLRWLCDENEKHECANLISEFDCDSNVELLFPRTPETWKDVARVSHVGVHLLFSVFGSPTPYLEISLSQGCKVLVSNFSSSALLPENIFIKLPLGDGEQESLVQIFREIYTEILVGRFNITEELNYAREFHDSKLIATDLELIQNSIIP